MTLIHLAVLLLVLFVGVRLSGLGIGAASGVGIAILVFVFRCPISTPPVDVVFVVLCIITASSALQACGGLSILVHLAEKMLRSFPGRITLLAPLVAYVMTLFAGTGYVAYALLPVIAEVSRMTGIRPERPLSSAVVASQMAITGSPVSAATAALVAMLALNKSTYGLASILLVCIPASLFGAMMGALSVYWRGDNIALSSDDSNSRLDVDVRLSINSKASLAIYIFLFSVLGIVLLGIFPQLRPLLPSGSGMKQLEMPQIIQIFMLSAVALMMVVCRITSDNISKSSIMTSGIGAILSIFGIAWMGNVFFDANKAVIVESLTRIVEGQHWTFAIALFALSALIYSQAATTAALMPVGFLLGIEHPLLIGMFAAVNGFFFFPTSGTTIAAVAFDSSGTTKIGKYVLNHSFMRPGLVAVISATVAGLALAKLLL